MTRIIYSLLLVVWLGHSQVSHADIIYSYSTDQSLYNVSPGQSLIVNVFLNETLSSGSTSLILNGAPINGLLGAGFYVTQSSGSGNTITGISANTNASNPGNINDGFTTSGGSPSSNFTSTAARLLESTGNTFGPTGTITSAGGGRILLGTVTVQAGAPGSSTTYSLQTYTNAPTGAFGGNGVDGNTVAFFGGNGLDPDVTNNADFGGGAVYTGADSLPFESFTVNVAAVPEPSSMILSGLAASIVGFSAWRRRRRLAVI